MLRISLFCTVAILSLVTNASPIPGAGSSQLPQLLKNIIVSEHGFSLGTSKSDFWVLQKDLEANKLNSYQYVGTRSDSKARFSVNIDTFTKPTSFDSYVKKWVKEYPYFGFEILKTQVTKLGGQPCYLVDFAHRKKNKQMRQFVVVRKDLAVVMTCADDISKFKETALQCSDFITNFRWTTGSTNQ